MDWTVGDTIKITATSGAKTGYAAHTILSNEGVWNAGTIAIVAAGDIHGVKTNHIDELTAGTAVLLHNLKIHADATLSGTTKVVEIDDNGTPYYFKVYSTKPP